MHVVQWELSIESLDMRQCSEDMLKLSPPADIVASGSRLHTGFFSSMGDGTIMSMIFSVVTRIMLVLYHLLNKPSSKLLDLDA